MKCDQISKIYNPDSIYISLEVTDSLQCILDLKNRFEVSRNILEVPFGYIAFV